MPVSGGALFFDGTLFLTVKELIKPKQKMQKKRIEDVLGVPGTRSKSSYNMEQHDK